MTFCFLLSELLRIIELLLIFILEKALTAFFPGKQGHFVGGDTGKDPRFLYTGFILWHISLLQRYPSLQLTGRAKK